MQQNNEEKSLLSSKEATIFLMLNVAGDVCDSINSYGCFLGDYGII